MENDVVSLDNCNKGGNSSHSSPLVSSNSVGLSRSPEKTAVKHAGKENTFPDLTSLLSKQNVPLTPPSTASPQTSSSSRSTNSAAAIDEAMATENRLYQARLIIESHFYQELLNRYAVALTQIHDLSKATKSLVEENELLRLANEDLARRLSCLLQFSQSALLQSRLGAPSPILSLVEDLRRNSISTASVGIDLEIRSDAAFSSNNSPTSVINSNRSDSSVVQRVSLPKSVSVRSSGYLKMNQPASNISAGPSRAYSSRPRVPSQLVDAARVYVKREERAVEMEVYNQGMYKTGLCNNKWQETGECPYGDVSVCSWPIGAASSPLAPSLQDPSLPDGGCWCEPAPTATVATSATLSL